MTVPSPLGRRPVSYSESDIRLPRIPSAGRPLLEFTIPDTPLQLQIQTPTTPPSPPPRLSQWVDTAHRWSLRFTLHIALISLFETVFFWQFVSASEDQALYGVIDGYTVGVFRGCAALTPVQRTDLRGIVDLFINTTKVDEAGAVAAAARAAFNTSLLHQSWGYFGGLSALFTLLAVTARVRGAEIRWRQIAIENLCLVTLLGLYEYMFFRTIVFPYKSVTMPELDQHVVDEFQAQC